MKHVRPMFAVALAIAICIPASALRADDETTPEETGVVVAVDILLTRGAHGLALPAFHDESPGGFEVKDLLETPSTDPARLLPDEADRGWSAATGAAVDIGYEGVAEAWLATYLTSDRFLKVTARLTAEVKAKAWLDGAPMSLSGDAPAGEITLQPGTSLLLYRLLLGDDPDDDEDATAAVGVELVLPEGADPGSVSFAAAERHAVHIRDVLDAPRVSSTSATCWTRPGCRRWRCRPTAASCSFPSAPTAPAATASAGWRSGG